MTSKKKSNKNLMIAGMITSVVIILILISAIIMMSYDGNWKTDNDKDINDNDKIEINTPATDQNLLVTDNDTVTVNATDAGVNINDIPTSTPTPTPTSTSTPTPTPTPTSTPTKISENTEFTLEAPLRATPTWFKVKSAIPSSNSLWSSEMTENDDPNTWISKKPQYYVLEDCKVKVFQDIPNIYITNYKTEGITNENGYTKQLKIECNSFSQYRNTDGKMYVMLESNHLASKTHKLGYFIDVPTSNNKVIVLKVIPDTYAFSTVMTLSKGGWLDTINADNIEISSMRPCMRSSNYWNLASLFDYTNFGHGFSILLSTDGKTWKEQTDNQKTNVADSKGNLHVTINPQILTENQGYTGTPFDMTTTGNKEFYIKFKSTTSSKTFKVTFDLTPTQIKDIKWTKI